MVKYFPKLRLAMNHFIMDILIAREMTYPLSAKNKLNPFFIIGAGRSGTTLLRTMLMGHPEIIIPPESFAFRPAFKKFHILQNSSWGKITNAIIKCYSSSKQFSMWDIELTNVELKGTQLDNKDKSLANLIDLIYREYGRINKPKALRWGDKTPLNTFYLKWVNKTFPNAKFINLIRDGRDVVSSLKVAGLSSITNSCLRWNQAIEMVREFEKTIEQERIITGRYEDLVSNTQFEIQNICQFLEMDFSDGMINHESVSLNMMDVQQYEHFKNLLNPINKKSIGKWKDNLSNIEKKLMIPKIIKNLKQLEYVIE